MKKLYVARPAAPPPEPEPEPVAEPEPVPAPEEDIALLRQGSITDPERVSELLDRLALDDKGRRGNAVALAFMVKDNGVSMLKVCATELPQSSARARAPAASPPPRPAPPRPAPPIETLDHPPRARSPRCRTRACSSA